MIKKKINFHFFLCLQNKISMGILPLPCADKKNNQKFFTIAQRVLVAQRSWKFQNMRQGLKFFLGIFLKLPNFFKSAPASDFWLSTPKKGSKNRLATSKSIFQVCSHYSNDPRLRNSGFNTREEFCPKIIFSSHNPKKLFFNITDP